MRAWLRALGWAKWPTLVLLLAPLLAYPSWQQTAPAQRQSCEAVIAGQRFAVFEPTSQRQPARLWPLSPKQESAKLPLPDAQFDSGAAVVRTSGLCENG